MLVVEKGVISLSLPWSKCLDQSYY